MDKKTLAALEGSIRKWEGIINDGKEDTIESCHLCRMYHEEFTGYEGVTCKGCPVAEKTGRPYCEGSPYEEWSNYDYENDMSGKVTDDRSRELAIEELEFLKSLLPNEKT
jgi:hypothetical protein